MKTEQILAGVNAAAQHLSEDEKKAFDYVVSNQLKKGTFGGMGDILGALVVNLRENLRNEEAKRSGRTGQKRALERIAKSRVGSKRDYMNGTFTSQDGARAVCDGYRAVRITNEAAAMPADAVERAVEPLNICACYESKATLTPCSIVPNPQKLRALIREARGKYHGRPGKKNTFCACYQLESDTGKKAIVNAEYLVDMLEGLPGASVQIGNHNSVQFYGPDGDGILCGLRDTALTTPGTFRLNF